MSCLCIVRGRFHLQILLFYVTYIFFQIAVESPLTEVEDETFSDSLQNLPKQNLLGVNIQINIQPASIVEDDSNRDSVIQQVMLYKNCASYFS